VYRVGTRTVIKPKRIVKISLFKIVIAKEGNLLIKISRTIPTETIPIDQVIVTSSTKIKNLENTVFQK
jgi:hypothetical protein